LIHAYGVTDKGKRVWLPIISKGVNWENVVLDSEGVIVQRSLKKQLGKLIWEPAVVITRDTSKRPVYYDPNPAIYCPVYCDRKEAITINVKVDSLPASVTPNTEGDISWVPGFAATAEEARKKAEEYIEKANKEALQ
jgi:hypothetical protein